MGRRMHATAANLIERVLPPQTDGFTLHAATRAGALVPIGRETLLRCVLRAPMRRCPRALKLAGDDQKGNERRPVAITFL